MKHGRVRLGLLTVGCLVAGACFLAGINRLDAGSVDKQQAQLEKAIHRAVTAEYAATGTYPGTLQELVQKYGLQIDEHKFYVIYLPVGENIAPTIEVLPLYYGESA